MAAASGLLHRCKWPLGGGEDMNARVEAESERANVDRTEREVGQGGLRMGDGTAAFNKGEGRRMGWREQHVWC